jgi:hypothetical protein
MMLRKGAEVETGGELHAEEVEVELLRSYS